MPRKFERWATRHQKRASRDVRGSAEAKKIVETIQKEAKENGATLQSDGKGGLDPEFALSRFRAAKWTCQNPACPEPKKDLSLDHASGHPKEIFESLKHWENPKLRAAATEGEGHKDDRFVYVLCAKCHDAVHQRERAIENGNKPPPMRGTTSGK